MIEAGLQFDNSIYSVVNAFTALGAPLRPTYFSHGEEVASELDRVDDEGRFVSFIARSGSGFTLLNKNATYSIRISSDGGVTCDCFLEVSPSDAEQFLIGMCKAKPIFGFACAPEEREQRNRIVLQQGLNRIESWVGRDARKLVPGFYWLTLLSNALAEQHNVPLGIVETVAEGHLKLDGGQHLFRFYEQPEGWRESQEVADLCASIPGVFDIEKIRSRALVAKDFMSLSAVMRDFR